MQFLVWSNIGSRLLLVISLSLWLEELTGGENFLAGRWVTAFEHDYIVLGILLHFARSAVAVSSCLLLRCASFFLAWLRNRIPSLTHRWPARRRIEVLRYWSLRASYSWLVSFQPKLHGRRLRSSRGDHFVLRVSSWKMTLIFLWLWLCLFIKSLIVIIGRGIINITLHIYNKSNYYYFVYYIVNYVTFKKLLVNIS